MNKVALSDQTPLWLHAATDPDSYDDPDDEAEPLEDDHYPGNDEYEEIEEDEL